MCRNTVPVIVIGWLPIASSVEKGEKCGLEESLALRLYALMAFRQTLEASRMPVLATKIEKRGPKMMA
jgi:hypothetical protein